jgi:hypothetical protein
MVIARNEYRIGTSSFRSVRRYFPYIAAAVLLLWIIILAPAFVGIFIDDVSSFFLSQAAAGMVQVLFFTFFFFFMTFPISLAMKEVKAEEQEIFLSAPINPSDILLGKFLGQLPFYAIGIALLMGFFTAVLKPLGLDFIQMIIAVIVSVVTFLAALWIGIVITAILRTKLGRTSRGKDIGKGLSMIIVLPVVALLYALMSGGVLKVLADPDAGGAMVKILAWFPTSWGAKVITNLTSHPGDIGALGLEALGWFGALLSFFIAVLWLGARIGNRVYRIETTSFSTLKAKSDGAFYNMLKKIGGGRSFGTILVSVFKDYVRRLQNLSRVVYVIGLFILLNIFFVETNNPREALLITQFLIPVFSAFVVGEVTLRGKENLFIYRKAPSGEAKVVKARLLQGWIVVIPIAALMAVTTLLRSSQTTFSSLLAFTGLIMIAAMAYVAFALGLFLLIPAFSEKSGEFALNIMILSMFSILLFIGSREILLAANIKSLFYVQILQIFLSWIVGIVILFLGKERLRKIE